MASLSLMIAVHILAVPDTVLAESTGEIDFAEVNSETPDYGQGSISLGKKPDSRTVHLLEGNLNFDLYQVPLLGSPEAPYAMVELFDYNCPSCRKVYGKMHDLMKIRAGQLAIVPLPVPMEADCNPGLKHTLAEFKDSCTYSAYAVAVCAADRSRFPEYHSWLMTGKHAPSVDAAREKAGELVGAEAFETALRDNAGQQWVADGLNIYRFLKAKTLPKIIAGDTVISSSGLASRKLYRSLEEALGLPAVED